jgi:hypothetical protein
LYHELDQNSISVLYIDNMIEGILGAFEAHLHTILWPMSYILRHGEIIPVICGNKCSPKMLHETTVVAIKPASIRAASLLCHKWPETTVRARACGDIVHQLSKVAGTG